MPMPPMRPAVRSERMSPNMFSITMTSKSQPPHQHRRAGIDVETLGGDAGMAASAFVEDLADEGVSLERVRLVDAGKLAGPPARLAAFGKAKREFKQTL